MKKAALIIFILGFILTGSFAQQNKDAVYGDDVYYSTSKKNKKDKKKKQSEATPKSSDLTKQVTEPDSTSAESPESSTLMDDYNDYTFSARIKRFHDEETKEDYFNETYTDPANYDTTYVEESSSPNVSLYVGAGYGSFYGPSLSFGFGWGYDPWYSNYYGWGYPYNSCYWGCNYWGYNPYPYYWSPYSYGYWNGYYNGYWDGYYDYPYGGNTYYGRRQPITSTGGITPTTHTTEGNPNTPTGMDGRGGNVVPTKERTTSSKVDQPAAQKRYEYSSTQQKQPPTASRTTPQNTRKQQPTPKYIKPDQTRSTQTTTKTQNYTSPAYRQPKSSQEYLSPRTQPSRTSMQQQTRSGQPAVTRPPATQTQRQNFVPSTTTRQSPGSTGTRVRPTTSPTKNYTPSKTPPTRSNSYSTPSRSNGSSTPSGSNSYSTPSRSSSPSYSSPSRSSGSSGSGGFGGRRK
ncbi:MAG: hypothetical protein IH596_14550 [Bacteroidales bacterium]|nr:hypothetical protein [Bacteroidales bacterium]